MIRALLYALPLYAMLAAFVWAIWAPPAGPQGWGSGYVSEGAPDTLEMRDSSQGHVAEVVYGNSAELTSKSLTVERTHNGATVRIRVEVTQGDERLTVESLTEGLVAVPPVLDVTDGEEAVVQIMRAGPMS